MANWENLPSTATPLNASNLETLYSLKQGSNNIAANTDLNTLTTPGTYKCISRANAETLTNSPYTIGYFKLIVENISSNDGDHIRQTILTGARNTSVYIRTNDANGWGEWGQLNGNFSGGELAYDSTYFDGTPDVHNYTRTGNVVQVSFRGKLANSVPNNSIVITLPYRSIRTFNANAFIGGHYSKTKPQFINVSANSKNCAWGGTYSGSEEYLHVDMTYITGE